MADFDDATQSQIESLARFPDENPHPVLRVETIGTLIYANAASQPLMRTWGIEIGGALPDEIVREVEAAVALEMVREVEVEGEGRTYLLAIAPVAEAGYINLYGRDITDLRRAEAHVRDLAKFPDENPHPVMRVSESLELMYANLGASVLLKHWKIGVGHSMPTRVGDEIRTALAQGESRYMEVTSGEQVYGIEISPVPERRYVNLYCRNVTAQKSAEQALIATRDQALEASRAKSAFLANMSHELRTPLNAIIGYSEMLLEDASGTGLDAFVEDISKIHVSGRHLLELINDILDLSKIEAGRMDLFLEELDPGGLIADVAATVSPLVGANANELVVNRPDELPRVLADQTKLRQILYNLLSNACKFTKAGTVTLTVGTETNADGELLLLTVADTGIGMSAEQAERVFGAFTQADDSTTREFGGTGLGLTITRRFCEMMGGRISVASVKGQGSTFSVRLPLRVTGEEQSLVAESSGTFPGVEGEAVNPVLIIDDDPAVRDILSTTLLRAGMQSVTAKSGKQGLAMAKELDPIAITLDIMMPGMDGWSVLSQLKSDPATQHIPVIVATIVDDRNLGFALGATEFMTKPIDRKRLVSVIRDFWCERTDCDLLIVDDEQNARDVLRKAVEGSGWVTREAVNGVDALAALEKQVPDVVLLDLMMPEMDGFEFLRTIRGDDRYRELPVVVVTARELSAAERNFMLGNVESVLQKGSYNRDDLLSQICESVVRAARRRSEAI